MSKGKVWNKGKHNGGKGGPLLGKSSNINKVSFKSEPAPSQEEGNSAEAGAIVAESRVDRIKKMNREHWISRPSRAVNESKRDENKTGNSKGARAVPNE
jgi:hypothetical protein